MNNFNLKEKAKCERTHKRTGLVHAPALGAQLQQEAEAAEAKRQEQWSAQQAELAAKAEAAQKSQDQAAAKLEEARRRRKGVWCVFGLHFGLHKYSYTC